MRKPQPPYCETPYVDYTGRNKGPAEPELTSYVPREGERLVTEIRRENGGMHYYENGVERPFVTYRTPATDRRLRALRFMSTMDRAGVGLAEVCVSLAEVWKSRDVLDFSAVDNKLLAALHYAPSMNFILFVNVDVPKWYVATHREGRYVLDTGVIEKMSYAYEPMRRDVCAVLEKFVAHLKAGPYYGRLAGFGLDGGDDGQFMQWSGYGYKNMGDYSRPMCEAFGREIPSAERRRGTAERLFLDETKMRT